MNRPLVSIIILSALRKRCTENCIKSIARFTPIDYEVIIVDMGGDETIKEWLKEKGRKRNNFKIIFNDCNVGTSKGRNQGIKMAGGEYVVFLDNDTMVTKHWLEALMEAAKKWSEAALFGSKIICPNGYVYFCDQYIFDHTNNHTRKMGLRAVTPLFHNEPVLNGEKEVPWYPTTCLMARRNVLTKLRGFNENLFSVEEDKDLCLRVKEKGKNIIYCPSSYVIHNRVKDNLYDKAVRYNNIPRIKNDIRYFELRWKRKVELIYSKECLKLAGYSNLMINNMQKGALKELFTVI